MVCAVIRYVMLDQPKTISSPTLFSLSNQPDALQNMSFLSDLQFILNLTICFVFLLLLNYWSYLQLLVPPRGASDPLSHLGSDLTK